MSNYPAFTQERHWFLTPQAVAERRADVRHRAIESATEARLSSGEPLQG